MLCVSVASVSQVFSFCCLLFLWLHLGLVGVLVTYIGGSYGVLRRVLAGLGLFRHLSTPSSSCYPRASFH